MPVEAITGINIPPPPDAVNPGAMLPTLEEIATCCVKHLRSGGYLTEAVGKEMLTAYLCALTSRNPPRDFLLFTAEAQAEKHSLAVDAEVARMQKVLRGRLHDQVQYWTFGPLPGRASGLYDLCPPLREICSILGCPALIAGETSIMHTASINPVAALVTTSLITREMMKDAEADGPFVFPFLIDLAAWNLMLQRHFAA